VPYLHSHIRRIQTNASDLLTFPAFKSPRFFSPLIRDTPDEKKVVGRFSDLLVNIFLLVPRYLASFVIYLFKMLILFFCFLNYCLYIRRIHTSQQIHAEKIGGKN
jgi:hypothetical protein